MNGVKHGDGVGTAVFVKIAHPAVVRILAGEPGFSHLILDTEHGAFSDADLESLCGLIRYAGKESIIRIPAPDPQVVGRALDRGADGVMIPRVTGGRDVEAAARGLVLAPEGERGWDPTAAGYGYGRGASEGAPRCYIQIETRAAFQEARRIGEIAGVTDLFIGPADLSRALDSKGEIFSPQTVAAIEELSQQPRRPEVRLGLFVDSAARARWAQGLGYRFLAVASDVGLLIQGAREAAAGTARLSNLS